MDEFKLNIYPDGKTYSAEFIERRRKQLEDKTIFYAEDWDGYAIATGICGNESKYEFLNKYAPLCCDSEIADCEHKYSKGAFDGTRKWVESKVTQMSEVEFWKAVALSNIYWKTKYQGWYEKEVSAFGINRNELGEGIATLYYKEGDTWKRVGEGYTTTIDLGLSTWEFEKKVWIRKFSFELSFYKKFKDADKWPVLKMEAKMPVVRRVGNGASLSVIYITANNVQVKEHFSDYVQVMLLQDENGYSMEMKVE